MREETANRAHDCQACNRMSVDARPDPQGDKPDASIIARRHLGGELKVVRPQSGQNIVRGASKVVDVLREPTRGPAFRGNGMNSSLVAREGRQEMTAPDCTLAMAFLREENILH